MEEKNYDEIIKKQKKWLWIVCIAAMCLAILSIFEFVGLGAARRGSKLPPEFESIKSQLDDANRVIDKLESDRQFYINELNKQRDKLVDIRNVAIDAQKYTLAAKESADTIEGAIDNIENIVGGFEATIDAIQRILEPESGESR